MQGKSGNLGRFALLDVPRRHYTSIPRDWFQRCGLTLQYDDQMQNTSHRLSSLLISNYAEGELSRLPCNIVFAEKCVAWVDSVHGSYQLVPTGSSVQMS